MKTRPMPSQEVLKSLFDYDPETGILTRKSTGKSDWCTDTIGYYRVAVLGVLYSLHRLAWKIMYGDDPESIDHINGNIRDNSIRNLRNVTHSENMKNRAIAKNNKSGYPGVGPRGNRWRVRIGYLWVGIYDTYEEAVLARIAAEKKHGYTTRTVSTEPKNAE